MADTLLIAHATAGAAGLVLGPLTLAAALTGRARRREQAHIAYQAALAAVCASALALAGRALGDFGFLIPVALVTQALAVAGACVDHRAWRAHGLGGSYLALVTALLVVSWPSPLAWTLPAAVGLPLILHAAHGRRRWAFKTSVAHMPDATARP